jgi:hypothetical protein
VYASVADLRDEGITPTMATDARLARLLDEASAFIDRVTGWFFESRMLTLRLDGRGAPTIEPPYPPLRLDALSVEYEGAVALSPEDVSVVGAPVQPGFNAPRLTLRHGRRFPRGVANVTAVGLWGFTEPDGTPEGRTPPAIHTVTMQLALRALPLLGDLEAWSDARLRWRLLEERTRDQSYKLGAPLFATFITGDPEIDLVLMRYRKPAGLGAA